jgi:hypothetical protein
MKKIITAMFIGLLLVCCWNPSIDLVDARDDDWWNTEWGYRKQITIDNDEVESNLENFPILFHNISSDFSDHAQSDGDDFIFISIDGLKQYYHEIEYYDSTTGELIAWVNITSLSSTEDTNLYIYYGNPSCSNQENIEGVWNTNYVGVWHCNNEVDNDDGDIKDSTMYNNNGTTQNMESGDLVDGRISKALNFDGINEKVLVYDSGEGSLDLTGNLTLECWWKASDLSDSFNSLMGKRHSSGYQYEYRLRDGLIFKNRYSLLTTGGSVEDNTVNYEDIWYYGTVTLDAKYITFYNDGTVSTVHDALFPQSNSALFGFGSAGEYDNNFAGIIDELRVSKVPRSAGWVETSYNSMNSPSTFLSVGTEESKPVNIPPTVEITYPEEGELVNETITITGIADDPDGTVEYVEVKIDDDSWETASGTTTWTKEWNTTEYPDGAHTIHARSYDGEDYSNIYTVNVTVYNEGGNIPPTVKITYPEEGETVSGTITITGNADDTDGTVEFVEVKIDNDNWDKASGTTTWTKEWNTEDHSDGAHTIHARSFDGEDYSYEYTVQVTVDNGIDKEPPFIEILTPHWGCIYFTVGGTLYVYVPIFPIITLIIGRIYVIVNATDNVGVEKVEFYVDDVLRDIDYEPPYIWLWDEQTPFLLYELKAIAYDFAGNTATDMIKVWRVQLQAPGGGGK